MVSVLASGSEGCQEASGFLCLLAAPLLGQGPTFPGRTGTASMGKGGHVSLGEAA